MIFPPPTKTDYTVDQAPDQTSKVVLITGGISGIGKEICHVPLLKNAKVYMGARSSAKAEASIEELCRLTGKRAEFLQVGMADFDSVRAAAKIF
ncbi:hypothetical protein IAR55_000035 [Kwoniella newhampshirensis]|uniref:Ketoreductase (KR) domain-containing protein n=1 Tax=Kwoniella newhampshirensis TaxID=1651941 RepID=A0AAW0Z5R5_9TREE